MYECEADGCSELVINQPTGRRRRFCSRRCSARTYRIANPRPTRHDKLAKYGLTVDAFLQMNDAQGGLCAICRRACDTAQRLSVDHDHETGRVRGLLCRRCNGAIGLFREDLAVLAAAIEYLRPHRSVEFSA